MRTIYKYTVPVDGRVHTILMPPGHIVYVASQTGETDDGVQFWAEVGPESVVEPRSFRVVGTGQHVNNHERYTGTALCPPFVWHLVEVA